MLRFLPHLSFAALALIVASCRTHPSSQPTGPAAPVKTTRNTTYQTPPVRGPVPRNPDMNLPSGAPKGPSITYTRVNVADKYIALTFDDGPHPIHTPRLLDLLRTRNVKATFFVLGKNVDLYPNLARRIVAEGHEIANHSYNHPLLTKLGDTQYHDQFIRTHESIIRATGVTPRVQRPPYGALTQRQRQWAHSKFGYPTILWSVDPLDWKRPGAATITSRIVSGARPGGILLAHDIHGQTIDAMPSTVDTLLRQGYKFVTVSQLLALQQSPASAPATAAAP